MVRGIDYGFVTQLQGKFIALWGSDQVIFGWLPGVVMAEN